MTRYIIAGSGAAGIAAIEAIRKNDKEGEILLIKAEKAGYYSRPGLAYYLTKEITEQQLYPFSQNDYKNLNTTIIDGIVKNIEKESQKIQLLNAKSLKYDKLLIAVGAQAVQSKIPGNDLEGIVYLDMLKSTKDIIKKARKAKSAVVIGGGITALELVEGLLSHKVKVHFFLRKDRYWRNVLDPKESKIVEEKLKEDGVVIHYNTEAKMVLGKKGKVIGIRITNNEEISCQIVAFAIGVRPRIQIAKNCGIEYEKGILVNQYLETNFQNVYAAGDVTQVFDPRVGKAVVDSLWDLARRQGTTAGINMSGGRQAYLKDVPFNVTRLAGLTTSIIGSVGTMEKRQFTEIARGESEAWHHNPEAIICENRINNNRIRMMLGKNTILGAIVMGDQKFSNTLHQLINLKVDISSIRNKLLGNNLNKLETLATFWSDWRIKNA